MLHFHYAGLDYGPGRFPEALDCQGPPKPQDVWPETVKQSCITTRASIRGRKVARCANLTELEKCHSVNIEIPDISSEFAACFEWSSVNGHQVYYWHCVLQNTFTEL